MKLISVVIPVFCEEGNIANLYGSLAEQASQLDRHLWEFIFINDGSLDRSAQELAALVDRDERCKVIELSRNFGKEIALSAGCDLAQGDAVIFMDADLQHPPEYFGTMIKLWEDGIEVVEMVREKLEKEPLLRKIGSRAFYFFLNLVSEIKIASQTTDFRLLDRKVVANMRLISERHRMFRGLVDWLGFKKASLPFTAPARASGESVYSYAKLANLAVTSFISYSSAPLRFIGMLGLLITLTSGGLCLWMATSWLVNSEKFVYTPLAIVVVANTFLIGLVLLASGIMSLYIGKIYAEVQNRPLYTIRDMFNFRNLEGVSRPTQEVQSFSAQGIGMGVEGQNVGDNGSKLI